MIKYETNSKLVKPGNIFVAIKGHTVDGHDYISDAVKNGAIKVIAEKNIECNVPIEVVKSTEDYLKEKLLEEYSSKLKNLKIIGVTGTNGKTTTCYLTYQLLRKLKVKVAYMGTIGFFYEDMKIELPNTTPDMLTTYKLLTMALEKGCTTIVMEVSSHAISLERIAGLEFLIGAFTNLTEDHLDYHKTMENYLETKVKMLNYMKPEGIFLVNNDDRASLEFMKSFKNTKTLGVNANDYRIKNYSVHPAETKISINYHQEQYDISTNLTGMFNVYNYITALSICHEYGFDIPSIIEITKDIYPPKGRCETYKVKNGYAVVDYAHTPDAVEKVIESYKELSKKRIITLVGCGGDRDPIKRPIMGHIASEKSDYVILTSDNPRTEDPKKIMEDILKGIKKDNYEVILDRKEAIKKALDMIEEEDIVLVLGKGHEDYQIIGHEKIHLDDSEEIQKYNKEIRKSM
ncbi:MAG: UDP-N-acetylmuramoyl-L-alanyl-D-glutamate--2,6-diaminopimelate ligase [Bacilli bacterium]|nr:UDP-N-acetylmuramoyl-L-alanyl-D-glutamate--2,6-diaminopimelate ligase [Bacilli bacterium]